MNPPLSIGQLKQLRIIMQTMLSEASNANWQELTRLDSERRVLINYKTAATDRHTNIEIETNSHARAGSATHGVHSSLYDDENSTESRPDSEYLILSSELIAIDKEISKTVQKARQALLEQTRGLRAQVSARKEYEQANIMKVSSYS